MIDVKFVNGKYVAVINGKTVKRSKKEHMDYVIAKHKANLPMLHQSKNPVSLSTNALVL